jgi:hypothetical protein
VRSSTERLEATHAVTVVHTKGREYDFYLTFKCLGDSESDCRWYPECACACWDDAHSHVYVQHDECWLQAWFENGAVLYVGEADNYPQEGTGRIEFEFNPCIGICWRWVATGQEETNNVRIADPRTHIIGGNGNA